MFLNVLVVVDVVNVVGSVVVGVAHAIGDVVVDVLDTVDGAVDVGR